MDGTYTEIDALAQPHRDTRQRRPLKDWMFTRAARVMAREALTEAEAALWSQE